MKIKFLITLCMTMHLQAMESTQDLLHTADMLTQQSYATPTMRTSLLRFLGHEIPATIDATDNQTNAMPMPSVNEIVNKVSLLQNQHGIIEREVTKKQAVAALRAALHATKIAIKKAYQRHKENFLQVSFDTQLISILRNQQETITIKIDQLEQKTIWQHLTSKPALYLATGAVMIAAGGAAYYYYQLQQQAAQKNIKPVVLQDFNTLSSDKKLVYHTLGKELLLLLDLNHKYHPTVHLDVIQSTLSQLDPEVDKDLIEILQTILEAQTKLEVNFSNTLYWAGIWNKRERYIGTIITLLNNDPQLKSQAPNGIEWTPEDINLKDVIVQKDIHPKTKEVINQDQNIVQNQESVEKKEPKIIPGNSLIKSHQPIKSIRVDTSQIPNDAYKYCMNALQTNQINDMWECLKDIANQRNEASN